MGGVYSTGLSVDCDRCKKKIPVADDAEADFYRTFSKREDQGSQMFQALLLKTDGSDQAAYFEYLCPKCQSAVATYMDKILMVKETKGKDEKPKPEKKDKPKPEAKAKPEAKDDKKPSVTIADETQPPPVEDPTSDQSPPPEDGVPGLSFDEEEMFASE